MWIFAFILFAVILVMLTTLLPKSKSKFSDKEGSRKKSDENAEIAKASYPAISVIPGKDACDAVWSLANKRYLRAEENVPLFPLPDCDNQYCDCAYEKHEDRREYNDDRRGLNSLREQLYAHSRYTNRRGKRGRRKSDWS